MSSRRWLGKLAWLPLAAVPAMVHADSRGWGSSRGGPERDGHRPGIAELARPQMKWRERLGGGLGTTALWLESPRLPRAYVAAGGRIRSKYWDDALIWETPLYGLDQIVAVTGDGDDDVVIAAAGGAAPALAAIGRLGSEVWVSPDSDLGQLGGVRVVDLDGDGSLDVYAAFQRAGSTGAIAAAYDLSGGLGAVTRMWTIPATDRDYVAGLTDVVAEIDGTPGLEIVAAGHQHVYTYDAATGALESSSAELPPLPYGRATLRPADLDGDGDAELVAFSNQAWAVPNNRRYVGALDWDASSQAMAFRWARDVADVVEDRVAFSDGSLADLDGDGALEIAVGVYEASRATWVLEVRDAATGALLDDLDGPRFTAVAGALVLTADEDAPLESYTFTRAAGLSLAATGPDRDVVECRVQEAPLAAAPRTAACVVTRPDGTPGIVVAERQPTTGRALAIEILALDTLDVSARFVPAADAFISTVALHPQPSPATLAVALTDGKLVALDGALEEVPPDPELPYAWPGIVFGTAFSGFDLPAFPLAVPTTGDHERILAVAGSGTNVRVLDASDEPSFAGGAEVSWIAVGKSRAAALDGPVPLVVTIDPENGFEARDTERGNVGWRVDELFGSEENVILHSDPLVVPGSPPRLWFHRRDNNRGAFELMIVDTSDGSVDIRVTDLDFNNAGWRRLSLGTDGLPMSGRLNQTWRFDRDNGSVVDQTAAPSGAMSIGVDAGPPATFLSIGLTSLSLHGAGVAAAIWNVPHANIGGGSTRQGALLELGVERRFALADAAQPVLVVYDVATGARIGEPRLVGGELGGAMTVPPPSLGNVTAVDDLTGDGDPAFLVGSSDGFVYAVAPEADRLLWSVDVGAPVGEIVPVDWDGDDALELVVSTADGTVIGLDTYTGEPPAEVLDIDPPSGILDRDVDAIYTESALHGAWTAVPEATSYRVAVFTARGEPMTDGFVDVGNVTSVTLDELALAPGERYVFAVRAVSPLGVSPDAISDGVTIYEGGSPVGSPGGCGCTGTGTAGGALPLLVVGAFAWRRRRR